MLVSRPEAFDLLGAKALTRYAETMIINPTALTQDVTGIDVPVAKRRRQSMKHSQSVRASNFAASTPNSMLPTHRGERVSGPARPMQQMRPSAGTLSSWWKWRARRRVAALMQSSANATTASAAQAAGAVSTIQ